MTVAVGFANVLVYLLVWVRLAGMLLLNPLLSRNNVPMMARTGLVFCLALLIAPLQPETIAQAVYDMNSFAFLFALARELAIGVVFGFVFQIFYYFLFFVGDIVDTDIGLAMAKAFDPATSIQTGFSSSFFTIIFALYLFATGGHLALIRIFADSFNAIQLGSFTFSYGIINYGLRLFTQVFSLAFRLVLPFMVAEFVLQVSMGLLMKFIPQITVFVINFQLRIGLGLIMLFAFAPFVGQFMDGYIDALFGSMLNAMDAMARASG